MPNDDPILKGLTAFIKSRAQQEQQKIKLQSALLTEGLKQRGSFMWKIAEKEYMNPSQRALMEEYRRRQKGFMGAIAPTTPTIRGYPTPEEAIEGGPRPTTMPGMEDTFGIPTEEELYERTIEMTPTGPKEVRRRKKYEEVFYERAMRKPENQRTEEERKIIEKFRFGRERKVGFAEEFNDALSQAVRGEISWDDVRRDYPTKLDEIEEAYLRNKPVFKSPKFREGFGIPALMSERIAKLTPPTRRVIENIKNEYDLKEFLNKITDYEEAGVDARAVLEYFGIEQ